MKHSFFSYRTGFLLTGITLVFVVGALAGTRLASPTSNPLDSLFTDLKSAVAPDTLAGWDSGNIFWNQDYINWPSSTTVRSDDTLGRTLAALNSNNSSNTSTVMDINGDGLQDVLIHLYGATGEAVFLNDGNLKFSLVYKCYYNPNHAKYYGDCAAI